MTRPGEQPPPDAGARERIRRDLDTTLLIEAAAGTGKTASLVARMVELVATGRCPISRLAAVTFTRKAAAELRARFTAALEREAGAASGERERLLREALAHAERCFVGTIHAFCARLLRERPIEAGVDVAFEELDEEADALLRERAWREFGARLHEEGDPRVARLKDLGVDLADLAGAFTAFATYPDVEEWPAPEIRLGDLVPARQALERYLARMRRLFPAFPDERGNDRLMARYEQIELLARHRDLGTTLHLMEVLEEFDRAPGAVVNRWPGGQKGPVKGEIETWNTFRAEVAGPFLARWRELRYAAAIPLLRSAVEVYDRLRAEARVLSFPDLLLGAAHLLRGRPAVRRYFRERITHLLVDEFQDTDPLQAEVVLLLTADDPEQIDWRACRPVPGSLCVVGDPKQSIYRFRRADIVTYQQVKGIIAAGGGAVVELDASFRTLPELVAWGNGVFAPPSGFPAAADRYSPAAHPLSAGRPAAEPAPGALAGVRTITTPEECSTNEACAGHDADRIARFIRHALDARLPVPRTRREIEAGVPAAALPGDFLIVAWRRDRLARYAAALQELGIPHVVSGGSAWGEVGELGLLAGLVRALVEPENPVALAGVLRGGLCGFSDEDLYALKRSGGVFRYTVDPPAGLAGPLREQMLGAFALLRRCADRLRTLPAVSALERITHETGLALRALAAPGGDGRAGSIAKAFAVLRAQGEEAASPAGIADLLEQLIEDRAPFDGLPARAAGPSVVRVMNLHKVKGLEAPVVFLADPGGRPRRGGSLHVDRSGSRVTGYLVVDRPAGAYGRTILAQPHGWEAFAEEEGRFAVAERSRLRYVAATRAGTLLVVTRRAGKRRDDSPWEPFSEWLAGAPELEDPGPQCAPAPGAAALTEAEEDAARAAITRRWEAAARETYAVRGAKEIALSEAELHRPPRAGEHGTEWGTVIHFLLETALREPGRDLAAAAAAALEEQGLAAARAGEALALVEAVRRSGVWRRAAVAPRRLVEAPFTVCLEPGDPLLPGGAVPTIVRGVVDLAFREDAGWAIVDWKTDVARSDAEIAERVGRYGPQVRLYAAIWARVTGEPVAETGLYFTAAERYERL
ncbi:MAG TPA: UvrD-helicase domain-containing protein [Candidatus Methanoperedens sp.]|nr:UvrD-helicase domain-containing protein [Candidatus Methanoperedens sp.]